MEFSSLTALLNFKLKTLVLKALILNPKIIKLMGLNLQKILNPMIKKLMGPIILNLMTKNLMVPNLMLPQKPMAPKIKKLLSQMKARALMKVIKRTLMRAKIIHQIKQRSQIIKKGQKKRKYLKVKSLINLQLPIPIIKDLVIKTRPLQNPLHSNPKMAVL